MKPSGAKFYKCALQVNSYRYNHDYRGGELFDEAQYNQKMVQMCRDESIEVIGLAEHGDVNSTENLRTVLEEAGITVFPGFELCTSEKVHIICLFPPNKNASWLNQMLGTLQGSAVDQNNKTDVSDFSYHKIAQKVIDNGGITYAAHVDEKNGLLNEGSYMHIWQDSTLVMGAQINKKEVDDLDIKFKRIIKNQDPNYQRDRKAAVINSKDIEKPETLADVNATCWIKMDTPSIEGLRQAFLDGDSRIRLNAEKSDDEHSKLLTLRLQSIFFPEGLELQLNSNLNALIGGRGTGKSTLIECLRYGMDLAFHSENAVSRAKELLKENFSDGKISISIYSSRYSKEYTIERLYGQPPVIKNNDGSISNLSVKDVLPEIEIFGQNEIFEFVDERENHVKILEKFLPQQDNQVPDIKEELSENREKLLKVLKKLDDLETQKNREKKLRERQKNLQDLGLDKKFKQQDTYNRERERILKRSEKEHTDINEIVRKLERTIQETDLQYLEENSLSDLINANILNELKSIWTEYISEVKQAIEQINRAGQQFEVKTGTVEAEWKKQFEQFTEEFEKLIRKLPDTAGRKGSDIAREFTNISRELAAAQGIDKEYKRQEKWKNELVKKRDSLLHELDSTVQERYEQIAKKAKKLNKKELDGKMKIDVQIRGNRGKLKEYLLKLPGIGERKIEWVDEKEDLTIRQLVQDIRDEEKNSLRDTYNMTTATAEALTALTREELMKLEEIVLEESLEIKLNIGPHEEPKYKDIQGLSSGQKCTAILNLLLLESKDPLVIDQPEDNLDNAFIAENIVTELRNQKEVRQFIFSTHNANIPVFGDAEWIAVMQIEQGSAIVKNEHVGSIDNTKLRPMVENILEGGKKAFEMRRLKYNF